MSLMDLIHVFQQPDLARRIPAGLQFVGWAGAIAVTRDPDEIESRVEIDLPGQIGQEDRRALEHSDENDGLAGEIFRDLLRPVRPRAWQCPAAKSAP